MKKIFVIFALFSAFFAVSCGSGDSQKNNGGLNEPCYPNKTCNEGLVCDEEKNICVEDHTNPADDPDTLPEQTDIDTDNDTDTLEQNDSDADTDSDDDADSQPEPNDDDTDTEPVDDADSQPEPSDDDADTEPTDDADSIPEPSDDDVDTEPTDDADSQPEPSDDDADSEPTDDADSTPEPSDDDTDTEPTDDADSQPEPSDDDVDTAPLNGEICAEVGGTWNEEEHKCTKTVECSGKPANSEWSSEHTSYTMKYTDGGWPTEIDARYISLSNGYCGFSCIENYFWNGSECLNPCVGNPCQGLENSTEECIPKNVEEYECSCESKYTWNGLECVVPLGRICTNQDKCYDNSSLITCPSSPRDDFFGQDAQYAAAGYCKPQSFTLLTFSDENEAVVFDNNTKLMWQHTPTIQWLLWGHAKGYCNSLTYGGYSDWRLPSPIEFHTISDINKYDPAFDTNYFPKLTPTTSILFPEDGILSSARFWTSQEDNSDPAKAKAYYIQYGDSSCFKETKTEKKYNVMCVRGNELPKPSFTTETINGDVVVTDSTTKLMWQKTTVNRSWGGALNYCEKLKYAGHIDWRLPNRNELASLLNYDKSSGPYSDFPGIPSKGFWTSSTYTNGYGTAWLVSFDLDGGSIGIQSLGYASKYTYPVKCVRNSDTEPVNGETCAEAGGTWNEEEQKCTKIVECSGKPANSEWSSEHTSYTMEYLDHQWTDEIDAKYIDDSNGYCGFSCTENYFWNGEECLWNPCVGNPCQGLENSTEECIPENAEEYECICENGYVWNGSECRHPVPLGNICTGQTLCYKNPECPAEGEDLFGQDAQYTCKCTAQSFNLKTIFKQTVVVDYNTGLTWEQSPSKNSYTWEDAPNHCADLNNSNYGGKSNWRVPNPLELLTIVDNSRYNPALNSNFTAFSDKVWTSKEYKGNTDYAYVFIPYSGMYYGKNSADYSKTFHQQVLCVSGDEMQPATSDNFTTQTINEAVVVKDSATGLMWQKEYTTGNWGYALKYCEDSTYADYSDWRLPNKNELASLINYEKPEAPYSYFPDMPNNTSNRFWSSTTHSSDDSYAWVVYFKYGSVGETTSYMINKSSGNYIRCVRNAD